MTAGSVQSEKSVQLDRAGAVRVGEELDIARVDAYVKQRIAGLEGTPTVSQFSGGASNLTYQLSYPQRDLILRRPPFGHKVASAHDMLREARIMQALKSVYAYVPQVLLTCDDADVMGCDFYVMERLVGLIPRQNLPKGLDLDEAQTRQLCVNVIDKLIELHQVNPEATGLNHLGKGEGFVQRQVEGWVKRYRQARTADVADFEDVMAWLQANRPAKDSATRVIHNDYRFDNVVLDPQHPLTVIGVLDWEMATLGDPLMDLGNSLAYWVQADDDTMFQAMRRQPTHLPGMLTRQEVIEYYAEKMGFEITQFDFYRVFGLFRLAVIVQQIWYRYFHGQTTNPQFAQFGQITNYLQTRCQRFIAGALR